MLKPVDATSWGSTQVFKTKTAFTELLKLSIVDEKNIDIINPEYTQRLAILMDAMGMAHPEEGFQKYLADAKAKFGVE